MELQHINIKFYVQDASALDFAQFNPVFQTWIQQKLNNEMLIDVADYLHVPEGPGMILVGLEADYAMDHTDGRWGLKYNRKAKVEGSNQDRLQQALKAALEACLRLEEDERLKGKLKFLTNEFEIFINDRALAPNNAKTFEDSKTDLETVLGKLFGANDFTLTVPQDPRARFGVTVKKKGTPEVSELLKNIL